MNVATNRSATTRTRVRNGIRATSQSTATAARVAIDSTDKATAATGIPATRKVAAVAANMAAARSAAATAAAAVDLQVAATAARVGVSAVAEPLLGELRARRSQTLAICEATPTIRAP